MTKKIIVFIIRFSAEIIDVLLYSFTNGQLLPVLEKLRSGRPPRHAAFMMRPAVIIERKGVNWQRPEQTDPSG